jgi:hypothetical protein
MEKWVQLARADIERARNLYEPIAGFSNVNSNLQLLYRMRAEQIHLQAAQVQPAVPKRPHPKRAGLSVRKWR